MSVLTLRCARRQGNSDFVGAVAMDGFCGNGCPGVLTCCRFCISSSRACAPRATSDTSACEGGGRGAGSADGPRPLCWTGVGRRSNASARRGLPFDDCARAMACRNRCGLPEALVMGERVESERDGLEEREALSASEGKRR